MNERDRQVGGVLEAERPVERRVAAADDHTAFAGEHVLLADEVVEPAALPVVDPVDPELARLERAVAGGDDDRLRLDRLAGRGRNGLDLIARRELAHLLAKEDVGAELESLLGAEVDEGLTLDLRMARDVVDVLLRVDRGDLAAELLEALEDADGRLAMAGVVGSREADGPGADDRDVVDHAG